MDLTNLSDEELSIHLNTVINEQERRQRLASAPAQLAALSARYAEDGGDKAVLYAALQDTNITSEEG